MAGIEIVNAVTGENYTLYHGDCFAVMPALAAQSVDATITDLPYGTTACAWDEIIPFAPMWEQVKRLLKPRGAFVTTSSQPFTSRLVMSNLEWFRYEWIWDKPMATGHLLHANKPLKAHENIVVFSGGTLQHESLSDKRMNYNPQMENGKPYKKFNRVEVKHAWAGSGRPSHRDYWQTNDGWRYPRSVLRFSNENSNNDHPTQKSTPLYEYLIRTYTNPGDVVDICMGSGTTGVAAMRTGRRFIGIELDAGYFQIAAERIANAAGDLTPTARERASGQLSLLDYGNDNE